MFESRLLTLEPYDVSTIDLRLNYCASMAEVLVIFIFNEHNYKKNKLGHSGHLPCLSIPSARTKSLVPPNLLFYPV